MLKRPNPHQESAKGDVVKRRRDDEGRRDELGEMREGFSPGLLVSRDFRTVNRHFASAFENGLKKNMKVSSYCQDVVDRARRSEDLAVKKMLFLTILCICPEVREYYEANCPPKKFAPWMRELPGHIEEFLRGKNRPGVSKCAGLIDAKYRTVASFVGAMIASYVSF